MGNLRWIQDSVANPAVMMPLVREDRILMEDRTSQCFGNGHTRRSRVTLRGSKPKVGFNGVVRGRMMRSRGQLSGSNGLEAI